MRILLLPLLLLAALPAIEIFLFVEVGRWIGAWPTVGLTLAAMVLGAFLIRYQGMLTLIRVRDAFARGEPPAMALLEGLMLLVSGFLFLVPGFLTDTAGGLLLIPYLRRFLIYALLGKVRKGPPGGGKSSIIEGEFRREDEPRLPK